MIPRSSLHRGAATALLVLLAGCDSREAPAPPEEIFACHLLLIGADAQSCIEDVQGPGTLTITFKPDPPQGSWEVGLSGLTSLAEACGFVGSYDQTRLANLQARGETEIVCEIAAGIDRSYHELAFESRLDAANTSISIEVSLTHMVGQ